MNLNFMKGPFFMKRNCVKESYFRLDQPMNVHACNLADDQKHFSVTKISSGRFEISVSVE